ncbi:MAG: HEPN domain-containing protein [Nitrososphaeria archaeon]|nr:HEPN domain-containing protein [Nitrososphaeria archaeon]
MVSRAGDWLRQALRDLEHAEKAFEDGHFEWACFSAQQAAEKAVKALFQHISIEIWGHSISRMLDSLPDNLKPDHVLVDKAKELDRHYIPTRYPNLHSEGAPMDYYTKDDARRAIMYAKEIIEFCRNKIV